MVIYRLRRRIHVVFECRSRRRLSPKPTLAASTDNGSALVIFYSSDLEATQEKVEKAGGRIVQPIFAFPGGRRFHFLEPSGNEFSVWSDAGT
ncbi:MAG: hypothetical protein U5K76_14090 [Woeseiaceae bacterium]|nr:hypothetical protein [Woeseiaceae bacterium]